LIARHVVDEYHLDVEEYHGLPLEGMVAGVTEMPVGQLVIKFSFLEDGTGRVYTAQFLVLAEAEFDIAIGGPFISHFKIYIKNPRGYIAHFSKLNPSTWHGLPHIMSSTHTNKTTAQKATIEKRRKKVEQPELKNATVSKSVS